MALWLSIDLPGISRKLRIKLDKLPMGTARYSFDFSSEVKRYIDQHDLDTSHRGAVVVIPRPSVNPIQGGLRVYVDMASTPCPKRNLFKIARTGVNVPQTGRFTFSIIWLTWIRITVTIQLAGN